MCVLSATSQSHQTLAVSLAEPKPTAEIIILTLIINKMTKIFVANITCNSLTAETNLKKYVNEFELPELNKLLSEGWSIDKYDIVVNPNSHTFSVIYRLKN